MHRLLFFVLIVSLSFFGCGQKEQPGEEPAATDANLEEGVAQSSDEMEKAMRELQEALSGTTPGGEKREVVDYQALKSFLPNRLAGMKQEDLTGEKTSAMGFRFSMAEATYRDNDRQVNVSISDFGGIGILKATMAAWTSMDYERESDEGYERTTTIAGYPAFEKFDRTTGAAEVGILVDDRFILSIDASNVSEKDLNRIVEQMDPQKLARLK